MLIILICFLIISSFVFFILKRDRETFYLVMICLSLAIMLAGISLIMAKKGGISKELLTFLFINMNVKRNFQYFPITLGALGYILAFGRYLFPMFLSLFVFEISSITLIRRNRWIRSGVVIIPVLSLIVYYPEINKLLTNNNPLIYKLLMIGSLIWIVSFITFSITILFYELFATKFSVFLRQYIIIAVYILSLTSIYLLYFKQDPYQVYNFYYPSFLGNSGIYYMKLQLSKPAYISIILFNIVFAILSFVSFYHYAKVIIDYNNQEIQIQKSKRWASFGTSVFVHSIKNQLLVNRVILKRIKKVFEEEPISNEMLKTYYEQLTEQNEKILSRLEELNRSVKSNVVYLVPLKIKTVLENALDRLKQKYPNSKIKLNYDPEIIILADVIHLGEALANLLINAQEAVNQKAENLSTSEIQLNCYNTHLYTVFEVIDEGIGMSKEVQKKIFEPFYSNKNSNNNWGMGLYYVHTIVKEHFGNVRFKSEVGKGSKFYIMLPKYKGG